MRPRLPLALLALLTPVAAAAGDPLAEANEAYARGDWARARELARQAPAEQRDKAQRIVAAASCFLRDRTAVLDAAAQLPKREDRELIRFACGKSGLEFSDDDVAIRASPARLQMAEAQEAYRGARYADAKRLALAATQADPKLVPAWRLLGAAGCWTKDKRTAQTACDHLQPVDQEVIRATCARVLGGRVGSSRVLR